MDLYTRKKILVLLMISYYQSYIVAASAETIEFPSKCTRFLDSDLPLGNISYTSSEISYLGNCQRDFKKVGCFARNDKVLTDLLITDLDPTHKNFTQGVDWGDYEKSLQSLACRCRDKARGEYKYFGIGFYGECLAGKDNAALESIFKKDNDEGCINGGYEECDHKDVNEICSGTVDTDYFYEILQGDCSKHIANGDLLQLFDTQTKIVKSRLITTISEIGMVFDVSFEVFPTKYQSGWASVLHLTTSSNNDRYGARIPGIWFYPSKSTAKRNKLCIAGAVIGNRNHYIGTEHFPLNEWIKVRISQVRVSDQYIYTVYINDKQIYTIKNTKPSYFSNVKVYAGDPWYNAQPGYLRNLKIAENCYSMPSNDHFSLPSEKKLVRRTKIGKISKFCKQYTVSLDVKPIQFGSRWRSFFHVTLGGNNRRYGDRAPGMWFWPSSSRANVNKFIVSSPISGNKNKYCTSKTFGKNRWINIKVSQRKVGMTYNYSVHVNGDQICSMINTKPMIFYDLIAYSADPWYYAQNGFIRNVNIDGGCQAEKKSYKYLQTPTQIVKNYQLTTIRTLEKEYDIYFEVRPSSFSKQWQSILHLTTGGNSGVYGYRTPGIWCWDSTLHFYSATSGNSNAKAVYSTPLKKDIWIDVKVAQRKVGTEYRYTISVGGKTIHDVVNTKPQVFSNVKVYVGDPWYAPLNGFIRDLYIGGVSYT